jgi:hypothetical protein
MVRFPNVDEDFVWIEQIIHRNCIEPGFEFFEKEILGEKEEQLDGPKKEADRPKQEAMPALSESAITCQHQPAEQGKGKHGGDEQVPIEAGDETEHGLAQTNRRGFKSENQKKPKRQPGTYQG